MSSVQYPNATTEPSMSSIERDEPPMEDEQRVAKQIKDIVEALDQIRSQLADQNDYLALLAGNSTKIPSPHVPPIDDDEMEYIEGFRRRWHDARIPRQATLGPLEENLFRVLLCFGANYDISISIFPVLSQTRSDKPIRLNASDLISNSFPYVIDSLRLAWPRHSDSKPDRLMGPVYYDTERSWFDFDWFFACCLDPYESYHETVHPLSEKPHLIELHELGYSSEAFPEVGSFSAMGPDALMEKFRAKTLEQNEETRPREVYGRILMISLENMAVLPMQTIAFVLWQLENFDFGESRLSGPSGRADDAIKSSVGIPFILAFTSPWSKVKMLNRVFIYGQYVRLMSVRFQVRWMKVSESVECRKAAHPGLYLHRDEGDIPKPAGDTIADLHLCEVRQAFATTTTLGPALPMYTLVMMMDGMPSLPEEVIFDFLERKIQNEKAGSYRAGRLMGVGIFLLLISATLEWVAENWVSSLDQIDDTLDTSLAQITRAKRPNLIFDNDQFTKSDQYFAALQVLHICTDWIKETLRGFSDLYRDINGSLSAERVEEISRQDRDCLDLILSAVAADIETRFRPLLDRTERKIEEVKGLRDGLFNATSVREASKGTTLAENSGRQNRYMLVFTVATVFYLPMGLVTSFFGMHLFDPNGISAASRVPFILTFVILSLATYFIAACALWFIRDRESVKKILAYWNIIWTPLSDQQRQTIAKFRLPNLLNRKKSRAADV